MGFFAAGDRVRLYDNTEAVVLDVRPTGDGETTDGGPAMLKVGPYRWVSEHFAELL